MRRNQYFAPAPNSRWHHWLRFNDPQLVEAEDGCGDALEDRNDDQERSDYGIQGGSRNGRLWKHVRILYSSLMLSHICICIVLGWTTGTGPNTSLRVDHVWMAHLSVVVRVETKFKLWYEPWPCYDWLCRIFCSEVQSEESSGWRSCPAWGLVAEGILGFREPPNTTFGRTETDFKRPMNDNNQKAPRYVSVHSKKPAVLNQCMLRSATNAIPIAVDEATRVVLTIYLL